MRFPLQAIRRWPRREFVKAAVVLPLALLALNAWLECVEALGGDRWESAWQSIQAAAVRGLLAWAVARNPAKWGFRTGLLGLAVLVLGAAFGAATIWVGFAHREMVEEVFGLIDIWGWGAFGSAMLALGAFTGAALSLRWLFAVPRWSASVAAGTS